MQGEPSVSGADVSQHLNLIMVGKACMGEPRSEPDSGNPTVRDRRGASEDVATGAGLRPRPKGLDTPPDPTAHASELYPDSCKIILYSA
jgi:hypothetical protein